MEIGYSHEEVKKLKELKDKVNEELIVVEGLSVLEVVLKNSMEIEKLFYCDSSHSREGEEVLNKCKKKSKSSFVISEKTFEKIREKDNSIPIIAVVKYKPLNFKDLVVSNYNFILVTDGIELPGNLGTMYRSSFAAGVELIINVESKTNIYKSKFISSSRGTIFDIPTINCPFEDAQQFLLENNFDILVGEPELGISYRDYDYKGKTAVVVGSERFGVNKKWYDEKHKEIYIPMKKGINSMNVGVAASIIMFEAAIKKGIL